MSRSTVFLLGCAVLLAAGGVALTLWDDWGATGRTVPVTPTRGEDTAEMVLEAAPLATGGAQPLALEPVGADASAAADALATEPLLATRVTGRAVWGATGRAAAGERLRLRLDDSREPTETITAEDGRYEFEFSLGSPTKLWSIEVLPGPETPRQTHRHEVLLPPGSETVLDLALLAGGTLAGRVVDMASRPVPGARVDGWSAVPHQLLVEDRLAAPEQSATTDATGTFALSALGPAFVLSASAEGLAPHRRVQGTVAEGGSLAGLELVVSAERQLLGVVFGPSDRPLVGVHVGAHADLTAAGEQVTAIPDVYALAPPALTTRTGADGRFRLASLCQRAYAVEVRHEGSPTWRGPHRPGDGELVVRLGAGLILRGTVRSAVRGDPLVGANLRLGSTDWERDDPNTASATTDEEGRFTFRGLVADEAGFLAASAAGHAVHVQQPLAIRDRGSDEVALVLEAERVLAGVVTDVDNRPVVGARLELQGDRLVDYGASVTMTPKPTWEGQFGARVHLADEAGRFRIGQLYDGLFRIEASDAQDDLLTVVTVRSGREDLHLVLDPGAVVGVTLFGVARDGSTGQPFAGPFFVTPMASGVGGGFSGTSYSFEDPEGRYRILALEPGTMLLKATAQGYAPWSGGVHELLRGEHRFDIELHPTRTVTFRVVDPGGAPVELNLGFRDAAGQNLMVASGPNSAQSRLRTGKDGLAIAAGLPAARITVSAKKGFFQSEQQYLVDLRSEPRGPVELVWGEPETRAVLVLVLTGTPSEPEPSGAPDQLAHWAEAQMRARSLRPVARISQLTATDAHGVVVAEATLDPADPASSALQPPGVESPIAARLDLPLRALVLTASAPGLPPATRAWDPQAGTDHELVVFLLRAGRR